MNFKMNLFIFGVFYILDHLNVGVAQVYLNLKRLDAEAKRLHGNATEFARQIQAKGGSFTFLKRNKNIFHDL